MTSPFRFIHGDRPKAAVVALIHAPSLLAAAFAYTVPHTEPMFLKSVLLGLLVWDLFGGLIAMSTEGTRRFYHDRPSFARGFLALHLVQPFLILWLFNAPLEWALLLVGAGAGLGWLSFELRRHAWARPMAAAGLGLAFFAHAFFFGSDLGGPALSLAILYTVKIALLFPIPPASSQAASS